MWQQLIDLPEWAYKASRHGEHGDIAWFVEGPVVGGKGPRQCTMPQGDDEVDTPEKSHRVVDLQVEEVPLKETLVVVFDKDAAGWGAAWVIWWGEVLRGGEGQTERLFIPLIISAIGLWWLDMLYLPFYRWLVIQFYRGNIFISLNHSVLVFQQLTVRFFLLANSTIGKNVSKFLL